MQNEYRELLKHVETAGIVTADGSIEVRNVGNSTLGTERRFYCLTPVNENGQLYNPKPRTPADHASICQGLVTSCWVGGEEWLRFPPEAIRHLRLAAGVCGNQQTPLTDSTNRQPRKKLTVGEQRVWDSLAGKILQASKIALQTDTTEDMARQHIMKIRGKGYAIENKSQEGYFRPDAPPTDVS